MKLEALSIPDTSNRYLPSNMTGHHSCIGALRDIRDYLTGQEGGGHKDPVFVFPPITPDHCEEFQALIKMINDSYKGDTAEIVLNDYGTIAYCKKMKDEGRLNVKLTIGLLLSGQDTDPFYDILNTSESDIPKDKEKILKHLSEPSVFDQTDFLLQYGITGIELCRQPVRIDTSHPTYKRFNIRLYDISVLSVKPCCGNCDVCGEKTVTRNGSKILSDRNLLFYDRRRYT